MINKLIIGAPFGNYITRKGVTSTIGTHTYHKRAGFLKRMWKVLSTVRYYPRPQSWIVKLGLPSPGIHSVTRSDCKNKILSIHGFDNYEWSRLIVDANRLEVPAIELNLSCPNVAGTSIQESIDAAKYAVHAFPGYVIAKLPPVRWMDFVRPLVDVGVTHFHLCNTIPTPGGGMGGKVLKQFSLWAVEEVRNTFGERVQIIGGGGITDLADVKDYVNAGADRVAVASMLFNPLNWSKLDEFREYLENL